MKDILGFKREKGRHGIRNLVAVIYTVECSRIVAEQISSEFYDARIVGFFACTGNADAQSSMVSLGSHPNVGAVLIVALGCEGTDYKKLAEDISAEGRMIELLVIQEAGGTTASIKKGKSIISNMVENMKNNSRVQMDISDLIIGIECGGSDATSGLVSNPAAGKAADMIVSKGGTVIVEEFKELLGCEQILESATVEPVKPKLRDALQNALRHAHKTGKVALTPGNIEGGLTTIEEKSLGAACKIGNSSIIKGILDRNERSIESGLYLLNTVYDADHEMLCLCHNGDVYGNTTLMEAHSHVIVFTTGRGNVVGSALSPVIKVTGNSATYQRMIENMDINAGEILDGKASLDEVGNKIFEAIISTSAGELTKNELAGHFESVISCQW